MPGLNKEVELVLKPLIPPHFQTNFIMEKKVVHIELSWHNSLQKAPVSAVNRVTHGSGFPTLYPYPHTP